MLSQRGTVVFNEIMETQAVLQATLETMDAQRGDLQNWMRTEQFGQFLFVGCGSSYYAAMIAARTIHMITGLNAWAWPSAEILLCPRPPYDRRIKTLQVFISRSGETTETLWALQRLQQIDPKANMLCITTSNEGTLGRMTTRRVLLDRAAEQAVAPTRSVTASTLAGQMLAAWLLPDDRFVNDLHRVPAAVTLNERKSEIQTIAGKKPAHTIMAGHGPMIGVAHEAAMKFKIMASVSSEVVLPMEMRHGLWSAVKPDTMSFFFQTETLRALEDDIIWECAKLTGPRCAFTEVASAHLKSGTEHVVELKSGLSECARAVPMMAMVQLLAFYLSIAKSANPEKPKHLVSPVRVQVPTA